MAARSSFKTGSCEMIVLHILKSYGDCYAYQISQLITSITEGQISFPEGSLYPAFYKLIDNGMITDYKKQTGRRMVKVYYHIEPKGEDRLAELYDDFRRTTESLEQILNYDYTSIDWETLKTQVRKKKSDAAAK